MVVRWDVSFVRYVDSTLDVGIGCLNRMLQLVIRWYCPGLPD